VGEPITEVSDPMPKRTEYKVILSLIFPEGAKSAFTFVEVGEGAPLSGRVLAKSVCVL